MTICPITQAKALIPLWMRDIKLYDGLEIHPVADIFDETRGGIRPSNAAPDETCFEQCEPEDAQAWSVFGHLKSGGVECFEDFTTEAEARAFADQLLEAWPHLKAYGVLG